MLIRDLQRQFSRFSQRRGPRIFIAAYLSGMVIWGGYLIVEDFVRIEPTPNWVMLPPKLEEALTKIDQRLDAVEARAIPSKEDIAALRTQLGSLDPSKLQLLIATADQYGGFLGNGLN